MWGNVALRFKPTVFEELYEELYRRLIEMQASDCATVQTPARGT